jgi:hypothetical protein
MFLAVAAMVAGNCWGAPLAPAGHHLGASAIAQFVDLHDHDSGDHDHHAPTGHATNHGDKGGAASEPSKVCCTSMTCAAMAVLTGTSDAIFPLIVATVSFALDDAVQTVAQGTIDPPPRLI